jgi:hypothetical protein
MELQMRKHKLSLPANADPQAFFLAAMRDEGLPLSTRLEAATAIAAFVHAPPAPVASLGIAPHETVLVTIVGGLPSELPALPAPTDDDAA